MGIAAVLGRIVVIVRSAVIVRIAVNVRIAVIVRSAAIAVIVQSVIGPMKRVGIAGAVAAARAGADPTVLRVRTARFWKLTPTMWLRRPTSRYPLRDTWTSVMRVTGSCG
jgi:hypothetical protein